MITHRPCKNRSFGFLFLTLTALTVCGVIQGVDVAPPTHTATEPTDALTSATAPVATTAATGQVASATPPAAIGSAAMTASAPLATPANKMTFGRTKKAAPVVFKHESHAEMAKCEKCHDQTNPLFPMTRRPEVYPMQEMYDGKTCGACHNGTKAFDAHVCGRCHGN